jgi:hypothetical protein
MGCIFNFVMWGPYLLMWTLCICGLQTQGAGACCSAAGPTYRLNSILTVGGSLLTEPGLL